MHNQIRKQHSDTPIDDMFKGCVGSRSLALFICKKMRSYFSNSLLRVVSHHSFCPRWYSNICTFVFHASSQSPYWEFCTSSRPSRCQLLSFDTPNILHKTPSEVRLGSRSHLQQLFCGSSFSQSTIASQWTDPSTHCRIWRERHWYRSCFSSHSSPVCANIHPVNIISRRKSQKCVESEDS